MFLENMKSQRESYAPPSAGKSTRMTVSRPGG